MYGILFITEQQDVKDLISKYTSKETTNEGYKLVHEQDSTLIENIYNDMKLAEGLIEYISKYQMANQMINAMENGMLDVDGKPLFETDDYINNNRTLGFSWIQLLGLISAISSVIIAFMGVLFIFITN